MNFESTKISWDIRGEGRAWTEGEAMERFLSKPGKIEMVNGKLLDCAEDREHLLCLLLENVGIDRAVQFGSPKDWRSAVSKLES
jgi:hypothetical protein